MKKLLLFVAVLLGSIATSNAQQVINTLGIIGSATPGAWAEDTDLTTTDNITYTIEGLQLTAGEVKFRTNDDWAVNWGGTGLVGTGVVAGSNIVIANAGTYNVSFNVETLAYSITDASGAAAVSVKGSAVGLAAKFLSTTDGETYTGTVWLIDGVLNFDIDGMVQGGNGFPEGISMDGSAEINATAGKYTVSFTKSTGAYVFTAGADIPNANIGLIGSATPGGWDTDTVMETADGVTYTYSDLVVNVETGSGAIKFRKDADWATNWGGPLNWGEPNVLSGTATLGGDDILVHNSTYDISINIITGAVSITDKNQLSVAGFDGVLGVQVASNPSNGGIQLTGAASVKVYSLAGQLVASANSDFVAVNPGTYIVIINGASEIVIVK
ncbi:MAG: SusF/SusE family outer membrane protein [Flavobacteriales bacterium]|nr:SusF/SusE family outer membrane protein [Flavobacteriales bacterium]